MKQLSTEVILDHARNSLVNAGGDVHDKHHADWLLQESIAYSLIAIAQELKKFNDRADWDRPLEVLSDQEREEIKNKKNFVRKEILKPKTDEDLG